MRIADATRASPQAARWQVIDDKDTCWADKPYHFWGMDTVVACGENAASAIGLCAKHLEEFQGKETSSR